MSLSILYNWFYSWFLGCYNYSLPRHLKQHIDFDQPSTVHFNYCSVTNALLKRSVGLGQSFSGNGSKMSGNTVAIKHLLKYCNEHITPWLTACFVQGWLYTLLDGQKYFWNWYMSSLHVSFMCVLNHSFQEVFTQSSWHEASSHLNQWRFKISSSWELTLQWQNFSSAIVQSTNQSFYFNIESSLVLECGKALTSHILNQSHFCR